MFRLLLIPVVLLALLGGAMLWSGSKAETKADFTFVNRGENHSLDPNLMSWMQDIRLAYGLWEGLYTIDPVTLDAIPGCAFPIDISPDKTVYTFHIRRTAKWSNGDDLQAKDFIFAWRRMLEQPGQYTYLLYYVKGAKEYQDAFGKHDYNAAVFSSVGAEALDAKTLRVTLIHPVAPFPDICTMPACYPLNERSMAPFLDQLALRASGGHIRRYDERFTLPPHLITNGPYKLESWSFKRSLRLKANPHYWNLANVKSKVIDQISSETAEWQYALYDTGRVNWIAEFSGDVAAELYKKGRSDLHAFPAFGTYFYAFSCKPKLKNGQDNPFADVRVRQAFCMSLDKKVIVDTITRMGEIPSTTYIPRGAFAHYQSPAGLAMNVSAAQELMAQAGYPNGRGFPALTLIFNNEAQHGAIAQNIHRQWLDALGVDVKLQAMESKMLADRQASKDFDITRAGWFGDYNDPSTFTDKYKPDSANNEAGWINPQYVALCNKADVEPDPAKRLRYFEQAEDILLKEAPILPIYTYTACYLFRDNVKGIPLSPRQMVALQSIEVKH
ncbi:MAG TPA: peptide ABC transporter substrate-binding protein [Tepidisphaeraceae bacterium]|nr:peptide ABC transporter substrate-binding protein [Tepidisphaeraceae bacterium]